MYCIPSSTLLGTKRKSKNKKKKKFDKFSNFRRQLFQDPKHPAGNLFDLKYRCSFDLREYFLNAIFSGSAPGYKYIFGGMISQSIHDINKKNNVIRFAIDSSIQSELEWSYFILEKYREKLNHYIKLKNRYEKSFILGNIENARSILHQINTEVSYSIWGCEQELLLSEIDEGFIGNKKLLSKTAKKTKNYMLLLLIDLCSYKSELDSSYTNFDHHLNTLNETIKDSYLSNYLNFKFRSFNDHNNFENIEKFNKVLCVESLMSIIDLYETFIRTYMVIVSSDRSIEYNLGKKLFTQLFSLNTDLNDYRIEKIQILYTGELSANPEPDNNIENILYEAMDLYTLGLYEKCIEILLKNFDQICNIFESIELITKCIVHLNGKIEEYFGKQHEFLVSNLFSPIYDILTCNRKDEALKQLMNTTKTICSSIYHDCLAWFCLRHLVDYKTNTTYFRKMGFLNSQINNPLNVFCYSDSSFREKYIAQIEKNEICKYTTQLFKSYFNCSFKDNEMDDLPSLRKDFYRAKSQANVDLSKGVQQLEKLLFEDINHNRDTNFEDKNLYHFHYERIASCLFDIYIRSGETLNALSLFIDSYLENSSLVLRMSKVRLQEGLNNENQGQFKSNIQFVIFQYLFDPTNHSAIYISLANFLDHHDMSLPSDLIEFSKRDIDLKNEIIFVLYKIYTKGIMKQFVRLNPSDRSTERIKILKHLITYNDDNVETYQSEINEIIKKENIKEKIKLVDEKKIFVDTNSILSEFDEIFSERFIRYKKLKGINLDFYWTFRALWL